MTEAGRRAVVIGAGVAGLTAALSLARAGAAVTVLEARPYLGGRYATVGTHSFEHAGRTHTFPIEHGLHGIWPHYRNMQRLLAEAGALPKLRPAWRQELITTAEGAWPALEIGESVRGSRLPTIAASGALLRDRRFRRGVMTSGPLALLRSAIALQHTLAFDPRRDLGRYEHLTVADLLHGWPRPLRIFFGALDRSAFFLDPAEVGLAPFLVAIGSYATERKDASALHVLRGDPGSALFEPLAERLAGLGAEVHRGTPAARIRVTSGRVGAVETVAGERHPADAVVLAVEPSAARALLPDEAAVGYVPDALDSVAVRLWCTRRPPPDRGASGVFGNHEVHEGPDNFFWLDRFQDVYAAWAEETGGGAVECHLYGRRADSVRQSDDGAVVAFVRAAVERAWPELRGHHVSACVHRAGPGHAALRPGTFTRLPAVRTELPGLALCGDWIACDAPVLFLERACVTGLLAARAVAADVGLPAERLPAPLPMPRPARSVAAARRALRPLRDAGWLPEIRRRRR